MKKKIILFAISLNAFVGSYAQQDQHFSMFTESLVYLNPASAGFTPGDLQFFTNYRNQWSAVSDNPYRTISASADWRMFDQGGDFLGAGVNFYNDVAGLSKYQTNIISMPINYAIQLDKDNFLSIGLQPAFYQRAIKNEDLTWDNQWTGVEFDPTIDNNETLLNQNFSISRFDVGAGVYWDSYINNNARIKLGIAGHHLTKQRINFTNDDERLYRRLNIHGQGEFSNDYTSVTILPAFVAFVQGPNKEIMFGSNFRFLLKGASRSTSYFEEITLSLGSYFRVGDAIVLNAIFDISGFTVGAAYDFNISTLSIATKGVGSMEFFLRYRIQFGTRALRNNRVH